MASIVTALTIHFIIHPVTVVMFWIMLVTAALSVISFILGGMIGEVNGFMVLGGILFMGIGVEALIFIGTLL